MPRYFFHVHDGKVIIDHEGVVLDGPDQARGQALVAAGDMLKDKGTAFWNGDWTMHVTDGVGRIVCEIAFSGIRGTP